MKAIEKSILAGSLIGHAFARRESQIHSQLEHPNIVKVYDVFETTSRYILYMEYAGVQSNYLVNKINNKEKIKN